MVHGFKFERFALLIRLNVYEREEHLFFSKQIELLFFSYRISANGSTCIRFQKQMAKYTNMRESERERKKNQPKHSGQHVENARDLVSHSIEMVFGRVVVVRME